MYNIIFTRPSYKPRIGGVTAYLRQLLINIDTKLFNVIDREKYLINSRRPKTPTTFDNISIKLRVLIYFFTFPYKLVSKNIDIVHANPSLEYKALIRDAFFIILAKIFKKNLIIFVHGWGENTEKTIFGSAPLRSIFKKIINLADTTFVLADEFRTKLRSLGINRPIVVESTMVDDSLLRDFVPNNRLRRSEHRGRIRILFLARITKAKGIYRTVDTYNLLRKRYDQLELVIAGDGPDLASVKNYVQTLQIPDVEFLGFVSGEKKRWTFERSDIYLFPTSHGEGMPISVLEAMAFGLPVITRPVGGIRDFFANGRHGFITESKSVDVFANLVSKLITDVHLYNQICLYNYSFAREYFMGSKVAYRVQAVYSELLEGNADIKDWYHR